MRTAAAFAFAAAASIAAAQTTPDKGDDSAELAKKLSNPINLSVSQLMKIGHQPVSFAAGVRSYVERPAGGPDWGLSFTVTFLFPK